MNSFSSLMISKVWVTSFTVTIHCIRIIKGTFWNSYELIRPQKIIWNISLEVFLVIGQGLLTINADGDESS